MRTSLFTFLGVALVANACLATGLRAPLDTAGLPAYLRDRGDATPVSMFGTYVQKNQWLTYLFFEYYKDANFEYKPSELGHNQDVDYRGDFHSSEELLYMAYGLTEKIAIEMEGALEQASLTTSTADNSGLPSKLEESGLGDVEGQLRWRLNKETATRPEVFGWFEFVFPTQDAGSLIGTTDWEFTLGSGLIRGFSWGTVSARASLLYTPDDGAFELGEVGIDWLRRLSQHWRVYGGFEGDQDEIAMITEAQWHFASHAMLKMNNSFGLTSKATDFAPEIGIMFNY